MSFKDFVKERIAFYVEHFNNQAPLLDTDGTPLMGIDLSFQTLSDEFLNLEPPISQDQPTLERTKV